MPPPLRSYLPAFERTTLPKPPGDMHVTPTIPITVQLFLFEPMPCPLNSSILKRRGLSGRTPLQREIVETLRSEENGTTAKQIAEAVGCTKRHVLKTLPELEGVTRDEGAGKYGADVYSAGDVPENGEADLQLEKFEDDETTCSIDIRDTLESTVEPSTIVAEPMRGKIPTDGASGPPGGGGT